MTVGPLSVREPLEDYADCHATPRALYFGDRMLTLLTVSEAVRVEAQLLGSGLRIVDAAGNLPAWPDLTELRRNVERFREATTTADMELARHDVITSALSLVDLSPSPEPAKKVSKANPTKGGDLSDQVRSFQRGTAALGAVPVDPDMVTITLSRDDAETGACLDGWVPPAARDRLAAIFRAALGEQTR